ncbi:MAG: hypothetical protein DRQ02_02635 [Candidatus Latescibacterota bacterium]|nr:MAG: hypothetical protein DRQ02_02635 [Candidatus Latescibacterota bacterium]
MPRVNSIADIVPDLLEGGGPDGAATLAVQRHVSVPLGAPLLVDGTTYVGPVFIAPCDGCLIKELWVTASVLMAGGTNTLAFDNYDASANSARNALSTTNVDPTAVPAMAKEGMKLTLSATETNLYMDEGDVLNFTLVCGTMTTDGEGYMVQAIILVPEIV